MGIDYNAELIIGFSLDTDKVKEWCNKQCEDIDDGDINELNKLIEEKYKLPEKIYKEGNNISSSFSIYIKKFGNNYSDLPEYFITFYEGGQVTIENLNNITTELLDLAKQIYKDIMSKDCNCVFVKDIPIFPVLYIW